MQLFLEVTNPHSVKLVILVEDPTRARPYTIWQHLAMDAVLLYILTHLVATFAPRVQFSCMCLVHRCWSSEKILFLGRDARVSKGALLGLCATVVRMRATPEPTRAPTLAPTRISTMAPTMAPNQIVRRVDS